MASETNPKRIKRRKRNNYRSIYIPEDLEITVEEIAEENEISFNRMMIKIIESQLQSKEFEKFLPKSKKEEEKPAKEENSTEKP